MFCRFCSLAVFAVALFAGAAVAAPCSNPNALGVSRVLVVDARRTPAVGSVDYGATLPLARREVVLTFDDGPRPPYTNRVLKALADECLQATFFMLGRQANANPGMVREIRAAGHTIGTHTQNHPMHRMSPRRAVAEISAGIDSVGNALGSRRALAPFFRFPGLYRTSAAEHYLRSRELMAWSIDIDSYDYRHTTPNYMLQRVLSNLERRQGGILLMHDIQPKTALILPTLLSKLKARGFRIVHVVPARRDDSPELMSRASDVPLDIAEVPSQVVKHRPRARRVLHPADQTENFEAAFTSSVR
jgi:peptidoglycan/xylan/chitin deacetylase (PgdA/CDA1 family)